MLEAAGRRPMPPLRSLSFSPLADADLVEITAYTTDRWGEDQTLRYMSSMLKDAERLIAFPLLGGLLVGPKQPTRALQVGRHVLIYRVTDANIYVLRIIHARKITRLLLTSI